MKRVRLGGALMVTDFLVTQSSTKFCTEIHGVSLKWIALRELHRGRCAFCFRFQVSSFRFQVFGTRMEEIEEILKILIFENSQ